MPSQAVDELQVEIIYIYRNKCRPYAFFYSGHQVLPELDALDQLNVVKKVLTFHQIVDLFS